MTRVFLLCACAMSFASAAAIGEAQESKAPPAQAPAAPVPSVAAPPAPASPAPVAPAPPASAAPAAPAPAPAAAAPAPAAPAAPAPAAAAPQPQIGTPATVLDLGEVDGIMGKSVRSTTGEDMGRIVDVIVAGDGKVRAAIIDFGGFLGVGSRKIAVDWNALKFAADGKMGLVTSALSRNQVRISPEYKPGEPIVVLGGANAEPEKTPAAPAPTAVVAPSPAVAPAPVAPAAPVPAAPVPAAPAATNAQPSTAPVAEAPPPAPVKPVQ